MAAAAKTETETLSWKVGGMDCASCAAKIRGAVERQRLLRFDAGKAG
ncbi:hypothetical protein [Bosea sp. Root483D1]|nr:hypothetical protein [Bosea sp. Root483D1]